MKKIKNSIFLFLLLFPAIGFAQGLVPCGGPGQPPCQLCHLFQLFVNILEFLLFSIVPPVAAMLFIWGGIKFYTSMGNPAGVEQGRKILMSVVVGIVIVYGSHFLISMILNALGVVDVQWPEITIGC